MDLTRISWGYCSLTTEPIELNLSGYIIFDHQKCIKSLVSLELRTDETFVFCSIAYGHVNKNVNCNKK